MLVCSILLQKTFQFQPAGIPRLSGQLPTWPYLTYQSNLIAVGKLGAPQALAPYLTWKLPTIHLAETVFLKEIGPIGEAENGSDAQVSRLIEARLNKQGTGPLGLLLLGHGNTPDLGKVRPEYVVSGTSYYLLPIPNYEEVPDVLVELG
jgi:hypothetical protein